MHPGARIDEIKEVGNVLAESESDSNSDVSKTAKAADILNEKSQAITSPRTADETSGITLFVRKSTGTTRLLKAQDNLLTLLDGPYHNNHYKPTLRCDRLLLIGGGIGISGLVPWFSVHPNVKLSWTVKASSASLVESMAGILQNVAERDIGVGRRIDVAALLKEEVAAGWKKIGVVICGPDGLCDDARMAVIEASKKGPAIFEMEVDAYSW
jgi:NAD(P)H-flavin reductase